MTTKFIFELPSGMSCILIVTEVAKY